MTNFHLSMLCAVPLTLAMALSACGEESNATDQSKTVDIDTQQSPDHAAASGSDEAPPLRAVADLKGTDGASKGSVGFEETPGGVLLTATLTGLPAGVHGFHIHETGACEPSFSAAGEHFAPGGAKHGFYDPDGPHAGDMPNIHVGENGALTIEIYNPRTSLGEGSASLFDDDGSAIIIHSGADDYRSQPSGAAGERIACGVIRRD